MNLGKEAGQSGSFLGEIRRNGMLYLIAAPGMVFFLVFAYLPMIGVVIAFQDFNPIRGLFESKFVGVANFDFFFGTNDWLRVTRNTLFLNASFILMDTFFQMVVAILLSEIARRNYRKAVQSSILLPYFISWPIVAMFSVTLFSTDSGFINRVLAATGVPTINFYSSPSVWPVALVLTRVWKGTGLGSVIYLAAITSIDPELYEAAQMDGANRWRRIFAITVPMLARTTTILVLLAVGRVFFGDFTMIYNLVGDNPQLYPTTDIIDTFVFRALRQKGDMGMSAAVGLYQSVFGFLVVILANGLIRRRYPDHALF